MRARRWRCGAAAQCDTGGRRRRRCSARLHAALARVEATEAAQFCAQEAIQLHGGVGFTWEYDPHLYFKRAQASSQRLAPVSVWCERVAAKQPLGRTHRMNLHESAAEQAFRAEVKAWMAEHLSGEFEPLRGVNGPSAGLRRGAGQSQWEQFLASGGWIGIGWPGEASPRRCHSRSR
ncbi:MAG: hypothetical protein IPP44_12780 [Ideonella sp.]|nr:hypothetical protein [Ideonella sp.]